MNASPTVRGAIASAATELAAAGLPSPRVDAEILAAHVLGIDRGRLVLAGTFTAEEVARFDALVAARRTRIPVQHLIRTAWFRRLELGVGPGVFVPRPETELLVEWGLGWLRSAPDPPTVVDLCAGSGAVAVSVAVEKPGSTVYAVERDPAALDWLRRNAIGHDITVVAGDVTDPSTLVELDGAVDLVLCNPPYVPTGDAGALPVEVTAHDPYPAVFGGADGLAVIRAIVPRVAVLLRPGGGFGMEHDDTHGAAVPALLRADGRFTDITPHRDLAGRPRFTTATRTAEHPPRRRGWQDGNP
jgi:release factor glutamine methyltransferase